jgi:transposase
MGKEGRLGTAAGTGAAVRDQLRHGVSGWHERPGAPEGGGCGQKECDAAQRDSREALGRSRGGHGTKACVVADGAGRALACALAPGQAHEPPLAPGLLGCLSGVPGWVVGDRGLASHAFRDLVWDSGARPAIPSKRNEEPVACPPWIHQNRNLVARLWAGLKEWRAGATRYEKTARSFMGVLCMAATMDWIKVPKS